MNVVNVAVGNEARVNTGPWKGAIVRITSKPDRFANVNIMLLKFNGPPGKAAPRGNATSEAHVSYLDPWVPETPEVHQDKPTT